MNDRNDRAIRVATKWYDNHLKGKKRHIRAVLLTEDADNRRKALDDGILVCSGKNIFIFRSEQTLLATM